MLTEKNENLTAAEINAEAIPQSTEDNAIVNDPNTASEEPESENSSKATEDISDVGSQKGESIPAPRQRVRTRRRTVQEEVNMDYLNGCAKIESAAEQYRKELRHIDEIIKNNTRVVREGRGNMQFITAMMTRNDEQREVSSDADSITSTHIYAREVLSDHETLGTIDLVFSGTDFLSFSGMEDGEGAELCRRQRQFSNHAAGSKFLCAPVEIVAPEDTESGLPEVICSRAFAMAFLQDRFFFGNHPLAHEGGHGIAYVMAGYPHGVRVEFGGVETFIPRGQLTSRKLITNASAVYKPGTGLDVSITHLKVDKENRTIELRLSGVQRELELGLVRNVKSIRLQDKPHHLAEVLVVTEKFYVVRIIDLGVIGLIPKEKVRPVGEELAVGDRVFMEITGVDEKENRVIGSCIKV